MDTSNESIIRALMVLQEVCAEHEDCNDCPLRDTYGDGCGLYKEPENWRINAPEATWLAFRN